MKPRPTMRPRPTAMLRASVLAAHVSLALSGTAWSQSATMPDNQTSATRQLRLATDSERLSATEPAPDDLEEDPAADQAAQTSTAPDSAITDPSDILDESALQELRRQNLRETTVDGLRPRTEENRADAQGIRMGSFILRPSITETIGSERTTVGGDNATRSYLRSTAKASLTSDWSLHQLKIETEGTWDKTLSGVEQDDPEGKIDAELRLDLSDEMTATLNAGYSLKREDISDPNAVANALTQSDVEEYTAKAELTRDLGVLRATAGIDFTRQTYGDAVLANGDRLSQADRDNNTGRLRGRLGYELSAALIPFIEASYGRSLYDEHRDALGFVRDASLYGTKAGVEIDLGEKLKGELAGGYLVADFDDSALKSISAATIDGNALWSPRRGTDIALNLRTEIEPTTTPGASGSTAYTGPMVLSQIILQDLTGQVSGGLTLRDFSQQTTPVQTVLTLGTGLTYGISRSLDLNADIAWEQTRQDGVEPLEILRAGIGLTLKR